MNEKSFASAFDKQFFAGKKILVDERLPQNCDFFLTELIKHYGYSIICYNNTAAHFESILGKMNVYASVGSVYDGTASGADIADDAWAKRHILHDRSQAAVSVYRSSTAEAYDYYDYDAIVRIEGLKSGCSSKIDGSIRVFVRDYTFYDFKYKILEDRIVYFD